ncbi:hypothetical protein EGW08_023414 [Elysia chlorotica]|uniref:Aminoacyl-transfer RNA synthetases class-II family profile domain-containing protein n=1 Tax=Elysia chlorotica TaxID=188477 RepID=A0A433SIN3_ELYCH|nr:hypothetical protein EGW08_023414 [Elysia chlorotica]
MEKMIRGLFDSVIDVQLDPQFQVMTYADAMDKYGSDKPDLRIPLEFVNIKEDMQNEEFKVFSGPANDPESRVIAMRVPEGNEKLTRKQIDAYTKFVGIYGAKGLAYIKINSLTQGKEGLQSPIVKNISEETLFNVIEKTGAKEGDVIFFGAGKTKIVNDSMGALRAKIGEDFEIFSKDWAPLWVIDFPMFEKDDNRLYAMHHPFTAPQIDSIADLDTNPEKLLSRAYDMVINGYEVGGGSIRIHKQDVQSKGLIEKLQNVVDKGFVRVEYTEAVEILKQCGQSFEYPVEWGIDLQSEHERYLCEKHFNAPVVIMNYPKDIKAFYMRLNDDGKTVAAMDVLVPGIGEIIGGSQREERLEVLDQRMQEMHIDKEVMGWYRDLRRYGTVPHSGFGLGFERLLGYITGVPNIRELIPFPRTPGSAKF